MVGECASKFTKETTTQQHILLPNMNQHGPALSRVAFYEYSGGIDGLRQKSAKASRLDSSCW